MSQDKHADQVRPTGAAPQQSLWLRGHRQPGRLRQTTLLVGDAHGVAALHQQLLRGPTSDYRVIGCCLPSPGRVGETFDGPAVLGCPDDVVDVVRRYDVTTVAVLPSSGMDGAALRRLEGDLQQARAELLLAPTVTEAAGTRIRNPETGPEAPRWSRRPGPHGVRGLVKASLDRLAAVLALLLLAPVLIGAAVSVKATSRGPVFVRQKRIGRDGRVFQLLRFRTAEFDAEHSGDRPAADGEGDAVSGISRGPRDTQLGSTLRRHSIDELPQLLNVLMGDMSLVGPRPGLPSAVSRSGIDVHGRLPVKPGLIDPTQVSGGQGRSRPERSRTDVDYAENWSLRLDLMILGKTFAAVLRKEVAP